jgi:Ca-activated chloride channel homolog
MHRRNNVLSVVAFLLLTAAWSLAQSSAPPQSSSPAVPQPPAQSAPQQPVTGQNPQQPANAQPQQEEPAPAPAPNQPGDTVQVPAGQAPESQKNDVYIFKKEVDEVTLHATVVDDHNRPLTGLNKNDFTVFEDGKPQKITYFKNEDIPVALGIVIDNSGSMRDKRPAVNAAAINLVRTSNPQDQVFIVNFSEEYFLDQDYTGSVPKLKDALERIESRGGTALYDAVVASSDHLKKSGALEKKVLLVVTDGEDNASRESLEQALRRLEEQNGPTIYTIGLLGEEHNKRARRALRAMAEDTGGVAFFPKDVNEVNAITTEIAHDIRNQYTIQYKPTIPQSHGGYRTVKVEAQAPGYKKLQVRTRSGYYAGRQQASSEHPSGSQ